MAQSKCPNPDCRQPYPISPGNAGKLVRCKKCHTVFNLERLDAEMGTSLKEDAVGSDRSVEVETTTPVGVPARLGRFEIRRLVGRGAFGAVYRAFDPQLEREVALKLLQKSGDKEHDQRRIARFLQEGRAAARLQHPHIVPVFDAGRAAETGDYYLAAAFIDGCDLRGLAKDQPLECDRAAILVQQLAEALDYAHAKGILHRDVKPDNVMVDREGTPFLMDFGLARVQESGEQMTQDGSLMGTPAYMSPEQCRGEHGQLTGAADQYSLGCLFYVLLTGRTPFIGPWQAQMHDHLQVAPEPPSVHNPKVPKDLETICLKMLSKTAGERYDACGAAADDLQRWQAGEPIAARPLNRLQRFARWCRREPVVASMAVGIFLVIAIGLAGTTWQWSRANELAVTESAARKELEKREEDLAKAVREAEVQGDQAKVETIRANEQMTLATSQSRRAYQQFYVSQMNLAERAWENGDFENLVDRLNQTRPEQMDGIDRRGFEWHYWNRRYRLGHVTFRGSQGWESESLAVAPNGLSFAVSAFGADGRANKIQVLDGNSGRKLKELEENQAAVHRLAWSSDGQKIVSGDEEHLVKIWDVASSKCLRVLGGHSEYIASVEFSPDGKRVVSSSLDSTAIVWDTTTGNKVLTISTDKGTLSTARFSPDGSRILSVGSRGTANLWDAASGEEILNIVLDSGPILTGTVSAGDAAFSPDGQLIAIAEAHLATVWDARTGQKLRTLFGHRGQIESVAFSGDSQRIVTGGSLDDRTVRVWDAKNGQELLVLKGHADAVSGVAFDRDGKHVFSGSIDGVIKWDAIHGQQTTALKSPESTLAVAFFNNNTQIACSDSDGKLRIWDANRGIEVHSITLPGKAYCLKASPNGQQVAIGCSNGTAMIWDSRSESMVLTLPESGDGIRHLAFSPDGTRLAIASLAEGVKVRDATTGELIGTIGVDQVASGLPLVFLSETQLVCLVRNNFTLLNAFDVTSGQPILQFEEKRIHGLRCLAVSPDRERLAIGCSDRTIQIYDAKSGQGQFELKGHLGVLFDVQFSPDGQRLASTCEDGTLKLWDLVTRQEVLSLATRPTHKMELAWSQDGGQIVSAHMGDGVKIWDGRPLEASNARSPVVATSPKQSSSGSPRPALIPFTPEQAVAFQQSWGKHLGVPVTVQNSIGMNLVLIPPGEFRMGKTQEQLDALRADAIAKQLPDWYNVSLDKEQNLRQVALPSAFYLGATEVTQAQFQEVMGRNPSAFSPTGKESELVSGFDTQTFPVDNVSWLEAVEFCNRLSQREGLIPCYEPHSPNVPGAIRLNKLASGYRLPTQAAWEFACRAGSEKEWWFGDDPEEIDRHEWTNRNSQWHPHPVGTLIPNPFGLYDMHGNLWEWCQDRVAPTEPYESGPDWILLTRSPSEYCVARGGAVVVPPEIGRAGYCGVSPADRNDGGNTFRVVLNANQLNVVKVQSVRP